MKLSHLYIMCATALLTTACTSEAEFASDVAQGSQKQMTFTVSQEGDGDAQTRVAFNSETKLIWQAGDQIGIFDGSSNNPNPFTLIGEGGTTVGAFEGTANESSSYTAVYPYTNDIQIDDNGLVNQVTLPNIQTATPGSFDKNAALFIAKSSDKKLVFKSIVSYFKVTPAFDCSEIVVKANKSDEVLAGKFDVTIADDGTPTVGIISEGSNTVKLKGTITAGKTYYIVLLPGTLSEGFTVTLKASDNTRYYRQRTTSYTVNRSDLCNLGDLSTSNMKKEPPYITFTASAEQGLKLFNNRTLNANGLQYSVDGGDWTNYTVSETVEFGGAKGDLRLRAKSETGIYCESLDMDDEVDEMVGVFSFTSETPVECSGDIRTLIDYNNYESANTSTARFSCLFAGLKALKSAPDLPITNLADYCYQEMFFDCTSLASAPDLPATQLAQHCYYSMFALCSLLTTPPTISATTLAQYCCRAMFTGCSNLTTAPELKATTLAGYCYQDMFRNCTSLASAPELKVSELKTDCYSGMFYGCTGLTQAPELPATQLATNCYKYMFYGCTGLTQAPKLDAPTLQDHCYDSMFYGCTGLTQAPELPATTLANNCYYYMFKGCTQLTTAPKLEAKNLKESCYNSMFSGCKKLTKAPELPALTACKSCYGNMFENCTGLTEAPALPATTLADFCYSDMFKGCTGLTTAPELKVSKISYWGYSSMFEGCSKLSNVKMLATDISELFCLVRWLNNAGKEAATRTLTLANEGVYNKLFDEGTNWLPEIWRSGNAKIEYESQQ